MKKILIAEDHSIVIRGMRMLIEAEFPGYALEIAKTMSELMRLLETNEYQLAIIDLLLQDGDAMALIVEIRHLYPKLNIAIFSANPEETYAHRLYREGIKGYVQKQANDSETIAALRLMLEGKTYISENMKKMLLSKETESDNPFQSLTPREMAVADLLIQGKRPREICKILELKPSTVATYKMKIFIKMNVNNVLALKELSNSFHIDPTQSQNRT